jgi:hypothetical protein
MREEWLGAWGEASDYVPGTFTAMVRLAPLTKSELNRAVTRPAAVEGSLAVDPQLAEEIVTDLRKPNAFGMGMEYVEPGLLQLVCQRLWDEATRRGKRSIDSDLYTELGGADQICRDFVCRELRNAGKKEAYFSELDRVLWVGLTRHMSAAHGVKSIVGPLSLARKLRTEDLGVAGPAALDFELTRKERKYLDKAPEKRGDPPAALVNWISRVLTLGTAVGFLKCQTGSSPDARLYELSHDSISPLLQQFAVDFESWVRARWTIIIYGLMALVLLGPLFVVAWVLFGLAKTLLYSTFVVLGIGIYVALVFGMVKVIEFVVQALTFPLMRLLCKGDPVKSRKRRKGI